MEFLQNYSEIIVDQGNIRRNPLNPKGQKISEGNERVFKTGNIFLVFWRNWGLRNFLLRFFDLYGVPFITLDAVTSFWFVTNKGVWVEA